MRKTLVILLVLFFAFAGNTQTNGVFYDLKKALEQPLEVKKLSLYDSGGGNFNKINTLQNLEVLEIIYENSFSMKGIGESYLCVGNSGETLILLVAE